MNIEFPTLSIAGCGAMGRGIAQIAAQAGSCVLLFDTQPGAAEQATVALVAQWGRLVGKDKITQAQADLFATRLKVVNSIKQLAQGDLVIEAIVEDLDAKVALLRSVEVHAAATTLLCTNTSSLSITALAAKLDDPTRLAGFHFFNPVPLMKVVEVIGAIQTSPEHLKRLSNYATQLGHAPVVARDSPGFIVNHAGRGYGTEALRIASEGAADYATIDRILRDQIGFKLGPFELMDLTGLDISHNVMESIYRQYYDEPRFRPSPITAQRLAAGMLGRKTSVGFYT
ncbi:MAG: 3-hydroxyacyl-CoA dehydrogenase NAD-binding domain-containing protein, partial [Rhodoferax sp.]